jgi:hypothetical protein
MNKHKTSLLIAGTMFVLSILACNLGKGPSSSVATPPPQDTTNPTAQAPSNNSSGSSSSACNNPYQPVVSGATWDYKTTGIVSDTFTRSIVSVEAGGFTDQDVFGKGLTRQGKWNCDNGNLIALDPSSGASASVSMNNVSTDFKTTELSGVTLPAQIKAGDSWTQSATIEGTETISGKQIPVKNKFTNTCKADGVESVTVAAGSFDAMKVECQTVMDISVTMQGNPVNTNTTFNSTIWYAEKVGMVKTSASGTGFDSTIELASYKIP